MNCCSLQDDEYVVYNINQQQTQYLVEFSLKGDTHTLVEVEVLSEEEVEEDDTDMEGKSKVFIYLMFLGFYLYLF